MSNLDEKRRNDMKGIRIIGMGNTGIPPKSASCQVHPSQSMILFHTNECYDYSR